MDAKTQRKRLVWIIIIGVLASAAIIRLTTKYAFQAPEWVLTLAACILMGVLIIPVGYVYGRNSGRKDSFGKLARFLFVGVAVFSIVSVFRGAYGFVYAFCGPFLVGHIIGWFVLRKARREHGDTPEAYWAERTLPGTTFLKAQDPATQKTIRGYEALYVIALFAPPVLGFWAMLTGRFEAVYRVLFLRPGDGTLYFITPYSAIGEGDGQDGERDHKQEYRAYLELSVPICIALGEEAYRKEGQYEGCVRDKPNDLRRGIMKNILENVPHEDQDDGDGTETPVDGLCAALLIFHLSISLWLAL